MARTSVTLAPSNMMSQENLLKTDNSLEFSPCRDADMIMMKTQRFSRTRKPVSRRLFPSPVTDSPKVGRELNTSSVQSRKTLKKKLNFPESTNKLEKVFLIESEGDASGTVKKQTRTLVSLFHNKKYKMDLA